MGAKHGLASGCFGCAEWKAGSAPFQWLKPEVEYKDQFAFEAVNGNNNQEEEKQEEKEEIIQVRERGRTIREPRERNGAVVQFEGPCDNDNTGVDCSGGAGGSNQRLSIKINSPS